MFGFVIGLLLGFGAKMAYDFFQEERIPTDLGMAQGRAEAMMDETRQIVREIRDELRTAASAAGASVSDKAQRLQSVASTSSGAGEAGSGSAPKADAASSPSTTGASASPNPPATPGGVSSGGSTPNSSGFKPATADGAPVMRRAASASYNR